MTVWPKFDENTDRRLNAPDSLGAKSFFVSTCFADLRPKPDNKTGIDTQVLFGESVSLLRQDNEWAHIQSKLDAYVGWTKIDALSEGSYEPTHVVIAPRTFLYPEPDMKSTVSGQRGMGSKLTVIAQTETHGTNYNILDSGDAIIADHVCDLIRNENDYVYVAEQLLRTPYLWGGTTSYGIDCSGLVQLSMQMVGMNVLRDSDMQAATIGTPINCESDYSNVRRGDLIFWRGHVGICQGIRDGQEFLIHANGHTMDVTSEPLLEAIERIEFLYERPIGVRRPSKHCG